MADPHKDTNSRVERPEKRAIREEGFCIRCAEAIPFNREKPYCADHYRDWSKWKNPTTRMSSATAAVKRR
jgi:hypothetical protein